jgi:hypothetical protein
MTQGRGILICAHVILGLPGESGEDIVHTARALAGLGIDGVKIHSLYVLKGTPMAELLEAGGLTVLDQETYAAWVAAFLENLPPNVVVQRLTGDPDPSALLAPAWSLEKQKTLALIQKNLEAGDTCQGNALDPRASARIFNI